MEEPFDIEIGEITYSVFPEENDTFTIFKDGLEFATIQKDTEEQWLKLDPETDMPLFEMNPEINLIGKEIVAFKG